MERSLHAEFYGGLGFENDCVFLKLCGNEFLCSLLFLFDSCWLFWFNENEWWIRVVWCLLFRLVYSILISGHKKYFRFGEDDEVLTVAQTLVSIFFPENVSHVFAWFCHCTIAPANHIISFSWPMRTVLLKVPQYYQIATALFYLFI